MSQSSLIRGLLLSSLVSTLSMTCALKVSAQVVNKLPLGKSQQLQTISSDQEILQKVEILQKKAANLRQSLDVFNLQLQEQLNSPGANKLIDEKRLLANWEQFNRIWHNFIEELEKNPEFAGLLRKDKVFYEIDQNLVFQEKIISNLAKILRKPSSLAIANFQEQLFTRQELNRNYYPYGTFEEKTQLKFALISTNKARELELQVSQVENVLAGYLLKRRLANNNNYGIVGTTQLNSLEGKASIDHPSKQIKFLNFNFLIVLTLLSSCAAFIFLKTYKQNAAVAEDQNLNEDDNIKLSMKRVTNYDVEDYLKNLQQVESQARELLDSTSQIIDNRKHTLIKEDTSGVKNSQFTTKKKENQENFNASSSATTKSSKRIFQEPLSNANSLMTEEDIIALYRENRQLLAEKSTRVEVTKESLQQIQTGGKSEIIFKETSNGSYWIVSEPKLENNCYFLVPSPILDITDFIPQSIDNIFTCTRYNNRTSNNFALKFSAMVQVNSSSSWKLIGTGEIIFS